jgi:hypothetical protein
MNEILPIILVVVLSGCATHEWRLSNGQKGNADHIESQCNYARDSAYPLWFCSGWPNCTQAGNMRMVNYAMMANRYKEQCMSRQGYRQYKIQ